MAKRKNQQKNQGSARTSQQFKQGIYTHAKSNKVIRVSRKAIAAQDIFFVGSSQYEPPPQNARPGSQQSPSSSVEFEKYASAQACDEKHNADTSFSQLETGRITSLTG